MIFSIYDSNDIMLGISQSYLHRRLTTQPQPNPCLFDPYTLIHSCEEYPEEKKQQHKNVSLSTYIME